MRPLVKLNSPLPQEVYPRLKAPLAKAFPFSCLKTFNGIAVWPRMSYFISLCFGFLIYKMRLISHPPPGSFVSIQWMNTCKALRMLPDTCKAQNDLLLGSCSRNIRELEREWPPHWVGSSVENFRVPLPNKKEVKRQMGQIKRSSFPPL